MYLENDVLRVELDDKYPAIRKTLHKPSGIAVNGLENDRLPNLTVNDRSYDLLNCPVENPSSGVYVLTLPDQDIRLAFSFLLDGNEIVFKLTDVHEGSGSKLKTISFDSHSLVSVGSDWKYYRRRYLQQPWDTERGKGLWFAFNEKGSVGAAIPDYRPEAASFSCLWKDDICITALASFIVKPMEFTFEDGDVPGRASRARLQAGVYHYRAGDKVLDPFEFRIAFLTDINGDGRPDYNDAALWYRRTLPEPNPIYRNSFLYKLVSVFTWELCTAFEQCLDVIRMVHLISDGMPQIVNVVGWQYDGHDTGYPALDKVNEAAGGKEKLLWLIEEGKNYNTTVSVHINLDDAYMDSPLWDPDIICRNPDGSLADWEVFNEGTAHAYHINHTKDVRSGKLFKRLDDFLALLPIEKSLQLDAFRFTNESWEENEHIGLVEELELGFKPILEYFRSKGIDPNCESVGYCPALLNSLFSSVWYVNDPLLQWGKVIGGGRGDNLFAWASGSSTHSDIKHKTTWGELADIIYLGTRLYQFYLTRELMEYRIEDGHKLYMRLGDDGIITADAAADTMHVQWGDIEVARDYDRFIPTNNNLIYAYSKRGGDQTWTLPADWEGANIEAHTITPDGVVQGPELTIEGRSISFKAEPQRPIRITKR